MSTYFMIKILYTLILLYTTISYGANSESFKKELKIFMEKPEVLRLINSNKELKTIN